MFIIINFLYFYLFSIYLWFSLIYTLFYCIFEVISKLIMLNFFEGLVYFMFICYLLGMESVLLGFHHGDCLLFFFFSVLCIIERYLLFLVIDNLFVFWDLLCLYFLLFGLFLWFYGHIGFILYLRFLFIDKYLIYFHLLIFVQTNYFLHNIFIYEFT